MNLQLLNYAEVYYQLLGYGKVSVPWLVDVGVSSLTKPTERRDFMIDDLALVGSAEQAYLQLMIEGRLKPGRYVTTTPCFRDEAVLDEYHKRYFLKTELIETSRVDEESLRRMRQDALAFFGQFVKVHEEPMEDGSWDIMDDVFGVELGSYGIRKVKYGQKKLEWVFGTGCAEPRLGEVIEKQKKRGYHKDKAIPKNKVGSPLKIFEEIHELQDALLNQERMLALCELADLEGAIKHYLKINFPGISISDLRRMSRLTEKAFMAGLR